jgi:1,4-dihydroxy-6-naphthoate synthase
VADPQASAAFVRAHAQEVDPEVCRRHIALYVNEFSRELGVEGRAAVETLLARGAAIGMLPRVHDMWARASGAVSCRATRRTAAGARGPAGRRS